MPKSPILQHTKCPLLQHKSLHITHALYALVTFMNSAGSPPLSGCISKLSLLYCFLISALEAPYQKLMRVRSSSQDIYILSTHNGTLQKPRPAQIAQPLILSSFEG